MLICEGEKRDEVEGGGGARAEPKEPDTINLFAQKDRNYLTY